MRLCIGAGPKGQAGIPEGDYALTAAFLRDLKPQIGLRTSLVTGQRQQIGPQLERFCPHFRIGDRAGLAPQLAGYIEIERWQSAAH